MSTPDHAPDTSTTRAPIYQPFQASDHPHPVQIPAVLHPTTGALYVIWTDITDCFPRAMRIQHGDMYVPFMRDQDLCRVRPHGIKYHPGVVLEVIYSDSPIHQKQQHRNPLATHRNHVDNPDPRVIHPVSDNHASNQYADARVHHSASTDSLVSHSHSSPAESVASRSTSHSNSSWTLDPKVGASLRKEEDGSEKESEGEPEDSLVIESVDISQTKSDDPDKEEVPQLSVSEALPRSPSPQQSNLTKQQQGHEQHANPSPYQMHNCEEKKDEENGTNDRDVHEEKHVGTNADGDAAKAATTITAGRPKDDAVILNKAVPDKEDHSKKNKKAAKSRGAAGTEVKQKPRMIREYTGDDDYEQTIHRLDLASKYPVSPGPEAIKLQRLADGQRNTLTNAEVARRRVQFLMGKRYRWIESCAPKLFVLLPTNYATSSKMETDFDPAYVASLNWTDFSVHFLCDCGGVPGFDSQYNPHWALKEYPWGHPITNSTEKSMIERFGSYMVCVLEMFKYGLDVYMEMDNDGGNRRRLTIPAETDPDLLKRIELAIKYLQFRGARTSDDFLNIAASYTPESLVLEAIVPIFPLTKPNLAMVKGLFFSDNRRTIDDTHPYLTMDRDIRWICLTHYALMSPQAAWAAALKYSSDPASSISEFRTCMGAFRAVITTRERARDYYRLGEQLTSTCVLRLFLDWDLTQEDEEELRVAVTKFSAACVRIQVRSASMHSGNVPGFGHGYSAIIFAALKNRRIEAFVMDQGAKDEPSFYGYDERYDVKRSFSARDALVRFKRSSRRDKMNLRILVTDIDRGVLKIRKMFEGLHHFTKLSLIISDIWEFVTITFLKPGMPGYEIQDTDFMSNRPLAFFEKRANMDSITYNCRVMGDNQFLQSKALTSLSLGFIYARDRNKVRDVLKNNKRLQRIELENLVHDDPSQIYESFKALLVNHPTLEKIEVKQRHARSSSDFIWREVSDPTKMNVMITIYEGDKVASMFQKYATSLRRINVCGISVHDAAVLEKVLRPKKGPFKLRSLTIVDAHLIEAAALEDLKKIVIRGDIEEVRVHGDITKIKSDKEIESDRVEHGTAAAAAAAGSSSNHMMADKGNNHKGRTKLLEKGKQKMEEEAAVKTADFVLSIAPKITGLSIWSNSCYRMLDALDRKRPYSPILPMLTTFSASGMHKRILDYRWLAETLLYKSAVIRQVMNEYTKAGGASGGGNSNSNSNNSNSKGDKDVSAGSGTPLEQATNTGIPSPGSIIAIATEMFPTKVVPLDDLSLQDFEVQPEDWGFLLSVLDFSKLRTFRLDLVNEITGEMLDMLTDAIPVGAPLESFSISVPGPTPEESLLCQQKIKRKVEGVTARGTGTGEKDKHVAILVNGFIG